MKLKLLTLSMLLTLAGCGGGGSDGGTTPTPTPSPAPSPTPTPTPTNVTILGDTQASIFEPVGLVATLNTTTSEEYRFQWTQESGEPVEFLASQSQVIGFDVLDAGDYQFKVEVFNQGNQLVAEASHTLVVGTETKNAGIRLDHAVVESGKVSLKADALPSLAKPVAVNWTQIAGPIINANNFQYDNDDNLLFFDAPTVAEDTLLQFEARIQLVENAEIVTDRVSVLVKNANINSNGYFPSENIIDRVVYNEMRPYNADSPYAGALQQCVYNNTVDNSCNFSTLPLVGQVSQAPTVEDIMDRTLVSHPWMGDRFKAYLENSIAAPDMLQLLKGVTAVVISYEVRPSFYWSATGAIYLDANNFWVTPQERDTLNDQPDFRSDFGLDLQFIMPWRYVRDGQNYLNRGSYPPEDRLSRSFADVEADITWLMYHELAHANDFFPPDAHSSISMSSSPLRYSNDNDPDSDAFSLQYPLLSNEMLGLAQVSFRGTDANDTQKAYTADDIEQFYTPDNAVMYYSYLTTREDYATLFERFMMAYRFGAEADVAILTRISDNPGALVTWGQRNRINDPKLIDRTKYTVRRMLPSLDVDAIYAGFNPAQLMVPNVSWFDNLLIPSRAAKPSARKISQDQLLELQRQLTYHHNKLAMYELLHK